MTATPPTNAELVCLAGRVLHGVDWQSPLSRDLGVQLRTVQRVAQAAGEGRDYPAARAWLGDLERLLADKARGAVAVQDLIRKAREAA